MFCSFFVTPEELGANPNQAERREAKASACRPEASCGGRGIAIKSEQPFLLECERHER